MKKHTQKTLVIAVVVCCFIGLGYISYVSKQKHEFRARESNFNALYYLAIGALEEDYESRPQTVEELLQHYGGSESVILDTFPDGILYQIRDRGFILEEPVARPTFRGRSDRLIANETDWPHWETSGDYIEK